MGKVRNAYTVLAGKPQGKRSLRKPRHRWVNSIKMDVKEIGYGSINYIDLAQDMDQWWTLMKR
jgi:hypothetical protein